MKKITAMKRIPKTLLLAFVLLPVALAFAACGGKQPSAPKQGWYLTTGGSYQANGVTSDTSSLTFYGTDETNAIIANGSMGSYIKLVKSGNTLCEMRISLSGTDYVNATPISFVITNGTNSLTIAGKIVGWSNISSDPGDVQGYYTQLNAGNILSEDLRSLDFAIDTTKDIGMAFSYQNSEGQPAAFSYTIVAADIKK